MKLLKLLIVVLISCFATLPLLAAEAVPENEAEETNEARQTDGDNVALDESASENDSDEASEEESPSRFIPTEQISQDLGVSFPADI